MNIKREAKLAAMAPHKLYISHSLWDRIKLRMRYNGLTIFVMRKRDKRNAKNFLRENSNTHPWVS